MTVQDIIDVVRDMTCFFSPNKIKQNIRACKRYRFLLL